MSLWTSLEPASASVEPGGSAQVRLRVRNTGDVVDEYRFEPVGALAPWTRVEPQTLRLYEREGLLRPSRTDGNTRLYSDEDLERLETILTLTRELGVNLAGVEIILNLRERMAQMQHEVNEFMAYVKQEMVRGLGDWEQRLSTALVKSSPTDLVRASAPPTTQTETTVEPEGRKA